LATGYKNWATGDVLTAADLEDYTVLQTVMRFASAAARDSALAAVLAEGQLAYLLDTNLLTMYDGSAWQEFNRNAARATYTPTLTQSGAVTKTVTRATVIKSFREVRFDFDLTVTGTGSAANDVSIELPNTAPAGLVGAVIGGGLIYDTSSTATYPALLICTSTTGAKFLPSSAGGAALAYLGSTGFTAALAAGDVVRGSGSYEATA
jgi:hypothetical protein